MTSKGTQSLTGIRFFAVLMIFLFHYSGRLPINSHFVHAVFDQLFLGVQVFFVLSGFVICYKYFSGAELKKGFLFTYYLRRFAKIYPTFFIIVTLSFLIWNFKGIDTDSSFGTYILNITFLKGLSSQYHLTGIGPTWSLTVEEFFYFFSPFIFVYFKNKGVLFKQVLFWWLTGAVLVALFTISPVEGFFDNARFTFFATFFGRCLEFYLGIWLALYISGRFRTKRFFCYRGSFPLYTIAGLTGMATSILLLAGLSLIYEQSSVEMWQGLFIANIVFPVTVLIFFFGLIKENSKIRSLLNYKLIQLFGKSSYVFFLIHTGVVASSVEKYISSNMVVLFIILQIVSILIYKSFEMPVNNWIRVKGNNLSKNIYQLGFRSKVSRQQNWESLQGQEA
ncbi:MAG: acyltransferase [Chitinophagaceae bacterium]|nr:acyltransferase [Chitinophagaceae bacterium]